MMGARLITGLAALSSAAILCGCRSILNPSDQVRHASYVQHRDHFTGNNDAVRRQTYIIFSGGPEFLVTMDSQTGSINWSGGTKGFSSGLAIGFARDGYLITSAHTLSANNFVFGLINGKTDVKPARVVFKRDTKAHVDMAILKLEGDVGCFSNFGERPVSGDRVFAVVCNRKDAQLAIDLASGTVMGITKDPIGSLVDLIKTDVPLRPGDSGGPLLSSSGQLVGINSGISFTVGKHWSDSFYPDNEFVQHLIAKDRLLGALNPPPAGNAALAAGLRAKGHQRGVREAGCCAATVIRG